MTIEIDEFAGQPGSYVVDPATGKRQLVERTALAPNDAPTAEAPGPVAAEPGDAAETPPKQRRDK